MTDYFSINNANDEALATECAKAEIKFLKDTRTWLKERRKTLNTARGPLRSPNDQD